MAPRDTLFPRERIERAARLYHTSADAGAALGIAAGSFSRLCRHYGILTPHQRRTDERRKARTLPKLPESLRSEGE